MTPPQDGQLPGERPPGDAAPQWHAPPRPRSTIEPAALPPLVAPAADPPPDPPPPRTVLDRLGAPFVTIMLLLVVGAAAWPIVRDAAHSPVPESVATPTPTRSATLVPPRIFSSTYACFGGQTLTAASGEAAISRADAERRYREGYELPFRASRLTMLADARLVTVGANNATSRAPVTPTPAPARRAWLLSFGRTTPLTAPLPEQQYPRRQEFTYALLDAASGEIIAGCDGAGTDAKAGDFALPLPPSDRNGQSSVTEAWAAGPAGGRVASWLPFTAAAALGTAFALPGGGRELIADYYAAEASRVGERIQIVSTAHAPMLRLETEGGEPIALGDGHPARLDLLGAITVLTWQDGDLWYQIVAVRPQENGAPFRPDDLLRIAAGLRSREGR